MKNYINILIFAFGIIIGAGVTYFTSSLPAYHLAEKALEIPTVSNSIEKIKAKNGSVEAIINATDTTKKKGWFIFKKK